MSKREHTIRNGTNYLAVWGWRPLSHLTLFLAVRLRRGRRGCLWTICATAQKHRGQVPKQQRMVIPPMTLYASLFLGNRGVSEEEKCEVLVSTLLSC